VVLPFLDTREKIQAAVREIQRAAEVDDGPPVVFSSVVDEEHRALLMAAPAQVFDIFDSFLAPLGRSVNMPTSSHVGFAHGIRDTGTYDQRVDAVNFALNYDDGARFKGLDRADVILIGVSRCGKTPTCLYLAMQYAVRAANVPLTEDDFLDGRFPDALLPHREHLFGLTISPERLHRIREERRPGSTYATLGQCRQEVSAAEHLFRNKGITFLDSTAVSIEELAIEIMQAVGFKRSI
jgi:hypothetical protein